MENKEQQLEQLVSNYIRVKDVLKSVRKELEELMSTRPKKPAKVLSLTVLNDFYEADKQYQAQIRELITTRNGLVNSLSVTEQAIIHAIPVQNVWVKVDSYAVGYYYDTWGGGHSELAIREWSDDLPELTDHTYYP